MWVSTEISLKLIFAAEGKKKSELFCHCMQLSQIINVLYDSSQDSTMVWIRSPFGSKESALNSLIFTALVLAEVTVLTAAVEITAQTGSQRNTISATVLRFESSSHDW